jgi:hypothetical protein
MNHLSKRAALSMLLVLGCYPDAGKIRHSTPSGGSGSDGGLGSDSASSLDVGPLLPPGAAADNCTDFGIAWCEKARQCQTLDVENLGGPSGCPGRMAIWCQAQLASPTDSNWSAAAFKTCITSWAALTCDEWRDFDLEILKGPSCVVPGKRGEGAGCWSFAQCGSGECLGETVCGTCRPRIPADGRCEFDSQCLRGLVCGQMKCAVPMNLGGACSDSRPCRRSLLCRNGTCGPRAREGEACAGHEDCAGGLLCNFDRHTCARAAVSTDQCGSDQPDGTVQFCAGGSTCEQASLTCVATAGDNASCVADGTPACLWPAVCSGGTCRLARPVDCPAQPVSRDGGP